MLCYVMLCYDMLCYDPCASVFFIYLCFFYMKFPFVVIVWKRVTSKPLVPQKKESDTGSKQIEGE